MFHSFDFVFVVIVGLCFCVLEVGLLFRFYMILLDFFFLQDLFGCSYQPVPGTVPVDSCPNDLCVLLVHFLLNIALGMGCSCTENGNRLAQYHEEE